MVAPPQGRADVAAELERTSLKLQRVTDAAFLLSDIGMTIRALPEIWRIIRNDPILRAWYSNLKKQYTPRLDYSAYAGSVVETTGYVGVAVGVEADLRAPLCRYLGGSFDAQAFHDDEGEGIAWSTRVTGCLPWGPFALELGFLSDRDVRVGLAAAPTTAAGRYSSQGFELRIRGFRWLESEWEIVAIPTEVAFVDVTPDVDDREAASFAIRAAAVRYFRYGAGGGGRDRMVEGIPVRVSGQQDSVDAMRNARVVGVGLVAFEGARLSPSLYLDGIATLQMGFLGSTAPGTEEDVSARTGGVELALHTFLPPYRGTLRYSRGLIPDSDFRLLEEDRGQAELHYSVSPHRSALTIFGAFLRTRDRPVATPARPRSGTFGATADYTRALLGPVFGTARLQAARSFYANAGGAVLANPAWELRASLSVGASWSSL